MAKTNYQYEKRQRDLAKKKKKEEKRLKKLNKAADVNEDNLEIVDGEEEAAEDEAENTEEDV
ncbi:MAG: hypothetical protein HQ557_00110 [Bacteroidetes bacterium]|nr:hypothetical protein [Bacteroidota bacterium]